MWSVVARERVMGAMTTRFGRVRGPSVWGVKRLAEDGVGIVVLGARWAPARPATVEKLPTRISEAMLDCAHHLVGNHAADRWPMPFGGAWSVAGVPDVDVVRPRAAHEGRY